MAGGFWVPNYVNFLDYGTSAISAGTILTANASTNTKGSYAQITASTTYDICGLYVSIGQANTAGAAYSVDLAVGAGGSEVIIIADISYQQGSTNIAPLFFPIGIPAGSRIAARCQSTTTVATIKCQVIGMDGNFLQPHLGNCATYGFNSSTTLGTLIDPGGTTNTKGSYAQITASTTYDINAVSFSFDSQSTSANGAIAFDLAVGAAASEVVVIPNMLMNIGTNRPLPPQLGPFAVEIPAGSRLAIRASSTNNTAGTRKFGATVYGIS